MLISVKCHSPIFFKGSYTFDSYESFVHWLADVRRNKKGVGAALCALAEKGSWRPHQRGYDIEATSDVRYGYDAKKLPMRWEFLKWGDGEKP